MNIVRISSVDSSMVYRIGIEFGLWRYSLHGRKAVATTRRCGYLVPYTNALGRKDAATTCGIDRCDALNTDKGFVKIRDIRVSSVPDEPDMALYNRLMQVIPHVDSRQAVPVHVIPQERIDCRTFPHYPSIEEREVIFDPQRQSRGVRETARRLGRNIGTISKELTHNRGEFGVYLPPCAHRKPVLCRFRPRQRKLDVNPKLRGVAWVILKGRYSPEQISGWLCKEYPDNDTTHASPETTY